MRRAFLREAADNSPMPNRRKTRDAELIREHRRLLDQLMRLGFWETTTHLAKGSEVAASTINRFMQEDSEPDHALSAKTIDKVVTATIERLQVAEKQETNATKKAEIARNLAHLYDLNIAALGGVVKASKKLTSGRLDQILVVGFVQGGEWADAVRWPDSDHYMIEAPVSKRYPGVRREALEVRGPSMNLLYPEGTIVLIISPFEVELNPRPGQRVVVQRTREDGRQEATIKVYKPDADGRVWLWPKSDHPDFQQPIELKPAGNIEEIKIVGLVVGVYREED